MSIYNLGLLVALLTLAILHSTLRFDSRPIQIQSDSSAVIGLPFPSSVRGVEFLPLEKIIWQQNFSKNKDNLVIENTLNWLETVYAYLENTEQRMESDRRSFLIKKAYPGSIGKNLSTLIDNYIVYKSWLKRQQNAMGDVAFSQRSSMVENLLSDTKAQQRRVFGEHAEKLFAKSNIGYNYLLRSKLVRLDDDLDLTQKKSALDMLRKQYEYDLSLLKRSE